MARARNIKPGFFSNDRLAEISPIGRLLFAGIWTIADREGRLEDRPKKIKVEVLPYDSCNVDRLLQELHDSGFILRYEANGNRYIQIVKWSKHQNPHVKEGASTIPAPDSTLTEHGSKIGQVRKNPERAGLIPDSLNRMPDSNPGLPLSKSAAAASIQTQDLSTNGNGAAAADLIFPSKFSAAQQDEARKMLNGIPAPQLILDELQGVIEKNNVRDHVAMLVSFTRQMREGTFVASHAHRVEAEREERQVHAEVQAANSESTTAVIAASAGSPA